MQPCLYCGGDRSAPDHEARCDGRQGAIEAREPVLRARNADPDTSHAAMAAFDPARLTAASDIAARLHRDRGPMADFEYKPAFHEAWPGRCDDSLYRQARRAARDRGQIRDSGERRVNPATNRRQVVWEFYTGEPLHIAQCPTCGHVLRREANHRDEARASHGNE